ncbi:MAG TPA: hypothetical protein ENG51_17385 [Deltaproteobacteria bacterium]|nr:hypothetical protein [Deltaproteobacteria bacterium]
MNPHQDQGRKIYRKVLRETGILVCIWVLIIGTGSFLLYKETIKTIEAWVNPLFNPGSEKATTALTTATQGISSLLGNLETYGTYVIVTAVAISSILFWLSLRQILKAHCSCIDCNKNGDKPDET